MVQSTIQLEQFGIEQADGRTNGGCGSCGSGKTGVRCGNGLEKIYPTTAIRFGYMRYIGEFTHAPDMRFTCGARVVIQTKRGIEIGEQVSLTCNGCDKSVTREQMKRWVEACDEDAFIFEAGRILREATAADLAEHTRVQLGLMDKRQFAQQLAKRYQLPLRVVESEYLFGGERIIFFFTAPERVDFREMVKELAKEYRTRIEMRQVGARDEARLLADYETCGREVCCKVFLKTLKPITMRMAKLQKATLDPAQVSGRCGRLKCCLRYEHTGYEELNKKLPRVGVRIRTNHGEGVVTNRQILTQLVQIRMDDDTMVTVVSEDITAVGVPAPPAPAPSEESQVARVPPRRSVAERVRLAKAVRQPVTPPARQTENRDQAPSSTDSTKAGEQPARRRRRRGRRRRGEAGGAGGPGPGEPGGRTS